MRVEVFALIRYLRRSEAGFGMIELVCAITVLSVGVLATYAMLESGAVQIRRAAKLTTASALAESEMETFRAIKYEVIGLDDSQVAAADATYSNDGSFVSDSPVTSLGASLTASSTVMLVSSAAGFPSQPPFRVIVGSEIMLVTGGAGTSTWTVQRAVDGTTASAHSGSASVSLKRRAHLRACGAAPCTTYVPTKTVNGADGKPYRVDTYIAWNSVSNESGVTGRNVKLVTVVVRDGVAPAKTYVRVSSSFDESTGL